ncbi:MAG: DUF3343 domain-containing protein [Clostridia bacterium]|nr:DUF3343 domain-containing protein [Clostridia bacterium]
MGKSLMFAEKYCLVVFKSTHHALAAEKALQEGGIDQVVIPTPKEISASCGLALKINPSDCLQTVSLLRSRGLADIKVYEVNTKEEPGLKLLEM